MGSPMSAPMANIFLCYHEVKWLEDCPIDFKPLFYRRYVDDTFLVFRERGHIDQFCNYLNQQHPNIRFTNEFENNGKLSFLDTNVSRVQRGNDTTFGFSVFRKLTFTGLGMNFHSYTFQNFKINNIKTLIFRAYRICSSWHDFDTEVKFLLNYFKVNGYPESIIQKVINRFLCSVIQPKQKPTTVKKLAMYVKFPFLNNRCCEVIKKELSWILTLKFPHIDFKFLFVNNTSIQSLLSHKERLPMDLMSGLIYCYLCDVCDATYVGQTKRCLRTRVSDHFGRSARTGNLLARPSQSAIRDHVEVCGSSRSVSNFKVLRTFGNNILLRIFESIEILTRNPSLNQDGSSYPLLLKDHVYRSN